VAGYILGLFTQPQTVTHPSTNRARRTVNTLMKTNMLPQSQVTTLSASCVDQLPTVVR